MEVLTLLPWEPLVPAPMLPVWHLSACQHSISCLQPDPHPLTWLPGLVLDLPHHRSLPRGPPDRGWPWTLPPDTILTPDAVGFPACLPLRLGLPLLLPSAPFISPHCPQNCPFPSNNLGHPHLRSLSSLLTPPSSFDDHIASSTLLPTSLLLLFCQACYQQKGRGQPWKTTIPHTLMSKNVLLTFESTLLKTQAETTPLLTPPCRSLCPPYVNYIRYTLMLSE